MIIRDAMIQMIAEARCVAGPVDDKSNLYTDLGFDSLSFAHLLIEIEEAFSISFAITEMEMCLQVGQLIALVEKKTKECGE